MRTRLTGGQRVKVVNRSFNTTVGSCNQVKLNRSQGGVTPGDTFYRLIETGDIRLTESGDFRILE